MTHPQSHLLRVVLGGLAATEQHEAGGQGSANPSTHLSMGQAAASWEDGLMHEHNHGRLMNSNFAAIHGLPSPLALPGCLSTQVVRPRRGGSGRLVTVHPKLIPRTLINAAPTDRAARCGSVALCIPLLLPTETARSFPPNLQSSSMTGASIQPPACPSVRPPLRHCVRARARAGVGGWVGAGRAS